MKIRINYDLLAKVKDANTGFLLQRTAKKCLLATSISFIIESLLDNTTYIDVLIYLFIS